MWEAQVFTILGMCFGILSYQGKTQKQIILFQHITNVFAMIGYFLLGGFVGAMLCLLAIFRNFIFSLNVKHKWAHSNWWLVFFVLTYFLSYFCSFKFFGKEPTNFNYFVEILPAIGSCAHAVAFKSTNAKLVRLISLIASPFWLTYNILVFSIGGMINESFIIVSIIIGYFRLDKRKKQDFLE